MPELYDWEKLVSVARCGSLTAAAEELLISQPALSRSMRKLESEIGVELFTRTKNRMELNDNGRLAAELARKLLDEADLLVRRVRQQDRSSRTLCVGSCAPAPIWELAPVLGGLYPEMTISTTVTDAGSLESGLLDGTYELIVLTYAPELEGVDCLSFGGERLCFFLPINHPLAGEKSLRMSDLNGETMLLRPNLGFWEDLLSAMPDTHFLVQEEDYAFGELLRASSLPAFTTDRVRRRDGGMSGRVAVPISDSAASVDYFVAFRSSRRQRLSGVIRYVSGYTA